MALLFIDGFDHYDPQAVDSFGDPWLARGKAAYLSPQATRDQWPSSVLLCPAFAGRFGRWLRQEPRRHQDQPDRRGGHSRRALREHLHRALAAGRARCQLAGRASRENRRGRSAQALPLAIRLRPVDLHVGRQRPGARLALHRVAGHARHQQRRAVGAHQRHPGHPDDRAEHHSGRWPTAHGIRGRECPASPAR
jgi:hypothetical protein